MLLILMPTAVLSCGGTVSGTQTADHDGGGQPEVGSDMAQGLDCPQDAPPGRPFTFVVRNNATALCTLDLGCSRKPPVSLTIGGIDRGIGPESVNFCGFTCGEISAGGLGGCTDCGPGYRQTVQPGKTGEIIWDRRVWITGNIPAVCSTKLAGQGCAMGVAVAGEVVSGKLEYCEEQGATGTCVKKTIPFAADMTKAVVEIVIP